ncbi:MAG: hypothetical protein GF398_17950 [Chitinivibrionales bacterium]|nr:hypothetical protein [Chitinivibrionales bacterium]
MTTLKEIEHAVEKLPDKMLAQFRRWFSEFDAESWDDQFEQDAKSGKLDSLANEALADLDSNRCTPL